MKLLSGRISLEQPFGDVLGIKLQYLLLDKAIIKSSKELRNNK
jgi:hypothetical protein